MFDGVVHRYHRLRRRLRRLERREIGVFLRWIEDTEHFIHLSAVVVVPVVIAGVTYLANSFETLSFLLFPPLAAGTYTLFADPEGPHSSPRRFVAGLTMGAICGWIAIVTFPVEGSSGLFAVSAIGAGFAVFLTGLFTWVFDIDVPAAFAVALLILLVDAPPMAYVASVAVSSTLVAGVFAVWRDRFYERRAQYLYRAIRGDDNVLVPIGMDGPSEALMAFGARLAVAHPTGRVVLLDVVDPAIEEAEVERRIGSINERAAAVEDRFGVPTEAMVARGDSPAGVILDAVNRAGCDLLVAPYLTEDDHPTSDLQRLLAGPVDTLALRSVDHHTSWQHVLVMVRGPGPLAHQKVDFARRIAGDDVPVSVATCIDDERELRAAEGMLANVIDSFDGPFETLVARVPVEGFLDQHAPAYDLVILGASSDRSPLSRFLSRPTMERLAEIETDLAVVHAVDLAR